MRKQRAVLKQVADAALARRYIDAPSAVEQHAVADHDAPTLRAQQAGDRLQRQRLAGPRRTEKHDAVAGRGKAGVQLEAVGPCPHGHADVDIDRH